jgi:diguanylate cyclase (GGDEF)-like protein
VLGLVSLAASAMFFALGALARQIAGVRYWAVACLAFGFATVIDGPRLIDDWRWASLFFNIPFGIGHAYMFTGTLDFCRHSHSRLLLPAAAAVAVVLTVAFTFVYPHTAWRIGTLCAYQALFNLGSAWIMFRYPDAFSRKAFYVAGTVAVLQGLTALAQGALVAGSSLDFDYGAPQLPIANTISWAGALLSAVIGNSMLMLLIMLRLVSEVSSAADRDMLTGVLNRRGIRRKFDYLLEQGTARAAVGIVLLDIDEFKQVNDSYGHDTGDQVIAAMGGVLRDLDPARVTASRWGGEEFCLVLEAATPRALLELAETIRRHFAARTAALPGLARGCTLSAGVAMIQAGTPLDIQQLIALADVQLYRAKRGGRDRVMAAAPDGGLAGLASNL